MVGGGCPVRTEAVSIVAPFHYSLQVYNDVLKVWWYNASMLHCMSCNVELSVYVIYYSDLILFYCNNCVFYIAVNIILFIKLNNT